VLRVNTTASRCLTVVAVTLSMLCAGCGSSNSGMANNSMSPAQAQAVTDQVVQALTQSLTVAISASAPAIDGRRSLSAVVSNIHPDTSSGCTSTATGYSCNWPIALKDDACGGSQGGTISVTGDISGSLSNTESGFVTGQFTITPANCSVSNLIINGDPSIDLSGQINFTSDLNPKFPITFTETGGISYGPSPSGSCRLQATYTINSSLGCTVSGTVCGQSVSGSC
jgi:predicted Fe-S protein YdhL (DUF1289 family)